MEFADVVGLRHVSVRVYARAHEAVDPDMHATDTLSRILHDACRCDDVQFAIC